MFSYSICVVDETRIVNWRKKEQNCLISHETNGRFPLMISHFIFHSTLFFVVSFASNSVALWILCRFFHRIEWSWHEGRSHFCVAAQFSILKIDSITLDVDVSVTSAWQTAQCERDFFCSRFYCRRWRQFRPYKTDQSQPAANGDSNNSSSNTMSAKYNSQRIATNEDLCEHWPFAQCYSMAFNAPNGRCLTVLCECIDCFVLFRTHVFVCVAQVGKLRSKLPLNIFDRFTFAQLSLLFCVLRCRRSILSRSKRRTNEKKKTKAFRRHTMQRHRSQCQPRSHAKMRYLFNDV